MACTAQIKGKAEFSGCGLYKHRKGLWQNPETRKLEKSKRKDGVREVWTNN